MKLVIEFAHGAKRETIEVSSADSIEMMRFQIYSLTSIPPHEQSWVINAGASTGSSSGATSAVSSSSSNDSAQIRSLGLKDGQRIIVTRKLTEASQLLDQEQQRKAAQDMLAAFAARMAASPAAAGAAPSPAAAPRPTAAAAPSAVSASSRSSSSSSSLSLQGCCSRSFFGPEAQTQPGAKAGDKSICFACAQTCHLPRDLKPRPSTSAFVCACTEDHECIFAARSLAAADLLTGLAHSQAVAAMRNAAVQMQEQQLSQGRAEMQARIDMHIKAAMEYENPHWQAEALALIPLARLRASVAAAIADGSSTLAPDDEFIEQLLRWFKHEFFKWTNAPDCDICGAGTAAIGADRPNAAELPFRPGRVEIYKCESGHITRFPRYNHAAKLLQTRRGRCGEWAQAFTLCVRACGFEARVANDWTDHVWTEIWSEPLKRWIHADSCEARRDAPMLYESGWGKKLSYIIACSKDEVVDVTQRYTKKWNEVLERRTACPEHWLNMHIASLSVMRFASLPLARQQVLSARRDMELKEFRRNVHEDAEARKPKQEELQGRTTGSVEWRAARGELGANAVAVERALNPDSTATFAAASSSSLSSSSVPAASTAVASSSVAAPSGTACKTVESMAQCSTNPTVAASASAAAAATPAPAASSAFSTTASAAAPPPSANLVAAARARTAALFRSYTTQLSVGCGRASCSTPHCKSNVAFAPPAAQTDLAKLALELTKAGPSQLCPGNRSKATPDATTKE